MINMLVKMASRDPSFRKELIKKLAEEGGSGEKRTQELLSKGKNVDRNSKILNDVFDFLTIHGKSQGKSQVKTNTKKDSDLTIYMESYHPKDMKLQWSHGPSEKDLKEHEKFLQSVEKRIQTLKKTVENSTPKDSAGQKKKDKLLSQLKKVEEDFR